METIEQPTPIPTFFLALWRISVLACLIVLCWVMLWIKDEMYHGSISVSGDVRVSGQGYGNEGPVHVRVVD